MASTVGYPQHADSPFTSLPTLRTTTLYLIGLISIAVSGAYGQGPAEEGGVGWDYEGSELRLGDALLGLAMFCLIVVPICWLVSRWVERPRKDSTWKLIRYGWPTAMAVFAGLLFLGLNFWETGSDVMVVFLSVAIFPASILLVVFFLTIKSIFDISPINEEWFEWFLLLVMAIATWFSWYVIIRLLERHARGKAPIELNLRSGNSSVGSVSGGAEDQRVNPSRPSTGSGP